MLVVHANPQDVNVPIFPTVEEQQRRVGEVRNKQVDEDLRPLLANTIKPASQLGQLSKLLEGKS